MVVANRVSFRSDDLPLGEQTVASVSAIQIIIHNQVIFDFLMKLKLLSLFF